MGMQRGEFAEFVTSTDYAAAFFSCSPTQKSYPSQAVGHGIWTHHLLRAFRGQESTAFARDRCITGESLRDYLAVSVPTFIREQTTIKDEQNPYAILAANGAFEILNVPESTLEQKQDTKPPAPMLVIDTAKAEAADREYGEQRQRLPDTDVMTKIWSLPRWRLWSRPMEFRKAQFKNLDHCAQFVAAENVRSKAMWSNIRGSARRLSTGSSRSQQKSILRTPALSTPSDGSCSSPGSSCTTGRSIGSCSSGSGPTFSRSWTWSLRSSSHRPHGRPEDLHESRRDHG